MKILLLSLLLFFNPTAYTANKETTSVVYVCDSENAVAYHQSASCRGIKNCTHKIIKISTSEAINTYHLRACKMCY